MPWPLGVKGQATLPECPAPRRAGLPSSLHHVCVVIRPRGPAASLPPLPRSTPQLLSGRSSGSGQRVDTMQLAKELESLPDLCEDEVYQRITLWTKVSRRAAQSRGLLRRTARGHRVVG